LVLRESVTTDEIEMVRVWIRDYGRD